jgi:hypothetical protein
MIPTTFLSAAAVLSIYDGRRCIGFILPRGKVGFEAFDYGEPVCVRAPCGALP